MIEKSAGYHRCNCREPNTWDHAISDLQPELSNLGMMFENIKSDVLGVFIVDYDLNVASVNRVKFSINEKSVDVDCLS